MRGIVRLSRDQDPKLIVFSSKALGIVRDGLICPAPCDHMIRQQLELLGRSTRACHCLSFFYTCIISNLFLLKP